MPPANPYTGGRIKPGRSRTIRIINLLKNVISGISPLPNCAPSIKNKTKENNPSNTSQSNKLSETKKLKKVESKATLNIKYILIPTFISTSGITWLLWIQFLTEKRISADYNILTAFFLLIPTLPFISYITHNSAENKLFQEPKELQINGLSGNNEEWEDFNISQKLKPTAQLLSIIIFITFSFVLLDNIVFMNRDLGAAIHLTGKQFMEYKYEWITLAFILIIVFYLTFIPRNVFTLLKKSSPTTMNQIFNRFITQESVGYYLTYFFLYITSMTLAIIALKNLIINILGLPQTSTTAIFILIFSSIAFTNGNIKILSKAIALQDVGKKIRSNIIALLCIITLIASLVDPSGYARLIHLWGINLGNAVSSPSKSIDYSKNSPYSCAFSSKTEIPEPIAFGILLSSKDSSIHMFSPLRDPDTGAYAYKAEEGWIYLYKLGETHIKTQDSYYVEKYDGSKHTIDMQNGKCVYKDSPPFYQYSFSWNSSLLIKNPQ